MIPSPTTYPLVVTSITTVTSYYYYLLRQLPLLVYVVILLLVILSFDNLVTLPQLQLLLSYYYSSSRSLRSKINDYYTHNFSYNSTDFQYNLSPTSLVILVYDFNDPLSTHFPLVYDLILLLVILRFHNLVTLNHNYTCFFDNYLSSAMS